ncbi:MAG TPA: family 10 glycosylhydrolase, partial [Longimicrobiales bacterium]
MNFYLNGGSIRARAASVRLCSLRVSREIICLAFALMAASCSDNKTVTDPITPPANDTAPSLVREMRGLWVATVANIDWPSRAGLTADQQRAELIDILNRAADLGINAVVLHVRPAADAVYDSPLEPWGMMLTGTQGLSPGYDPLAFAIQEAHARGMELHAWINPFRAGNARDSTRLAASHVFNAKRSIVRVYGTQLWLDPGEPETHEHSLRVIRDIVTRYDIDALHADDYFYPYVETDAGGTAIAFPDDATYAQHGSGMTRADWRRANVDRFVERMYNEVHAIKPTVKVGISPFGIWRPNNPPGVQGLDAYASIYADSRKWLQQGWVDYLAPQLYWAISAPQQSFPALLDWWLAQNTRGRHVWPGLAAYRVNNGTSSAFSLQEIPQQIDITRQRAARGQLLYNTTWTLKQTSGQLAGALSAGAYASDAVMPATPWLDGVAPGAPSVTLNGTSLRLTPATGETVRWWVLLVKTASGW